MPELNDKVSEYERFIDKIVNMQFPSGYSIDIKFKTNNFPHLVGLHQYTDIDVLRKLKLKRIPARSIWKQVKNKKITMKKLRKSVHFQDPLIRNRILEFSYDRLIRLFSQEVVIYYRTIDKSDFDVNVLLFEEEFDKYYLLGLKRNDSDDNYYPASFLVRNDAKYIENQEIQKAVKIEIRELASGMTVHKVDFRDAGETTA